MITVKMVIGLLAFEERAESLLRRGFIIVPWGQFVSCFFNPMVFKCSDEIKLCRLFFFGPSSFIRSRKQKAVIYNAHNCCILYLDYNFKFHMLCNKAKTASQKNSWRLDCLFFFLSSLDQDFQKISLRMLSNHDGHFWKCMLHSILNADQVSKT